MVESKQDVMCSTHNKLKELYCTTCEHTVCPCCIAGHYDGKHTPAFTHVLAYTKETRLPNIDLSISTLENRKDEDAGESLRLLQEVSSALQASSLTVQQYAKMVEQLKKTIEKVHTKCKPDYLRTRLAAQRDVIVKAVGDNNTEAVLKALVVAKTIEETTLTFSDAKSILLKTLIGKLKTVNEVINAALPAVVQGCDEWNLNLGPEPLPDAVWVTGSKTVSSKNQSWVSTHSKAACPAAFQAVLKVSGNLNQSGPWNMGIGLITNTSYGSASNIQGDYFLTVKQNDPRILKSWSDSSVLSATEAWKSGDTVTLIREANGPLMLQINDRKPVQIFASLPPATYYIAASTWGSGGEYNEVELISLAKLPD